MPIYNCEKYLKLTVLSILRQSFVNFELICVNDGSSDNSLKILQELKEIDNRIVIIDQENRGVSAARNKAIKYAKGQYICFFDADDLMHCSFLEKMYLTICQKKVDIVYCDYENVPENCATIPNKFKHRASVKKITNPLTGMIQKTIHPHVVIWNKIYRSEFVKSTLFIESLHYAEDVVFTYQIFDKAKCVAYLKETLVFYRQSENSLTRSKFKVEHITSHIQAFKIILSTIDSNKKGYRKLKNKFHSIVFKQVVYTAYKKVGKDCINLWQGLYDYILRLKEQGDFDLSKISFFRRFFMKLYLKRRFKLLLKLIQILKKAS